MKGHRRYIEANVALRQELIDKGFIIPFHMVPAWLLSKGYEAAAAASAERRGL